MVPTHSERSQPDAEADAFYQSLRLLMVQSQLRARNIRAPEVLRAMATVPRHEFVPPDQRPHAYDDGPLSLGPDQTISQPYIVALMTQESGARPGSRVLEIGTGSGYHSAVLSKLASRVFTIEINPRLGRQARENLRTAGCRNVHARVGDGYQGWADEAPFDAIILTAAPPRIPQPLIDQLRVGGKMVVPEGGFVQNLVVVTKTPDGYEKRVTVPVSLPPMSGEAQQGKP